MLSLDSSFIAQVVTLFLLWAILKRLVWDPMVQMLGEREARTVGARAQVQEMKAVADGNEAEYDKRLRDLRGNLQADAQAVRARLESEERRILDEAQEQSSKRLSELRQSLTQQAQAARAGMDQAAQGLAGEIVQRVVGRSLS